MAPFNDSVWLWILYRCWNWFNYKLLKQLLELPTCKFATIIVNNLCQLCILYKPTVWKLLVVFMLVLSSICCLSNGFITGSIVHVVIALNSNFMSLMMDQLDLLLFLLMVLFCFSYTQMSIAYVFDYLLLCNCIQTCIYLYLYPLYYRVRWGW